MPAAVSVGPLSLLSHPYRSLRPVSGGHQQLRVEGRRPGSSLVWRLAEGPRAEHARTVQSRPGGLALIVILPPAPRIRVDPELMRIVEASRPQAILPHHEHILVEDLKHVLRRPPEDLAAEVTEYVAWRGVVLDRETVHVLRKTLTLSAELRSISALSRSLYLSRRALGRRLLSRGLPVPSHWLQLGRLLRVAIRLQNSSESVLSIGYEVGYADAFSLSNQMHRLTGFRPSQAREYLGWEWLLEAWLCEEARTGGLAPEYAFDLLAESPRSRDEGSGNRRASARAARTGRKARTG
jgi:AraC-like DNA-binding protein